MWGGLARVGRCAESYADFAESYADLLHRCRPFRYFRQVELHWTNERGVGLRIPALVLQSFRGKTKRERAFRCVCKSKQAMDFVDWSTRMAWPSVQCRVRSCARLTKLSCRSTRWMLRREPLRKPRCLDGSSRRERATLSRSGAEKGCSRRFEVKGGRSQAAG